MDELLAARLAKLEQLRARGVDPYPARVRRTHTAAQARELARAAGHEARSEDATIAVCGRVMARRDMGRATFVDLQDGTGRIQALLRQNVLGADAYKLFRLVDLGDFIGVEGQPMLTRTGEPTVEAHAWQMVCKALHAPPEKFHGLADPELRQRRRYLDLMANEETRRTFRVRTEMVRAIRRFLDERGFMEVETPVLQEVTGGAAAKPFVTHYDALDEDRYLRISLELYLKRLIVGGYDKVYELGRNFRNEGLGWKYNPEFTMLETYEAYTDYHGVAEMAEELIATVASEVLGTRTIRFRDHEIDLEPPFARMTMYEALERYAGLDAERLDSAEALRAELERRGIHTEPHWSWGKLLDEAMSTFVEPHLIQPTFLLDYPVELSPLAKRKPDNPRLVERFELFIGGLEAGNAYTELNDPIDQRRRFEEQLKLRAAGDEEAEMLDEDFLFAIEHGMPPTGGFGMGVDRLAMLFTGHATIREVILFPQLRKVKT